MWKMRTIVDKNLYDEGYWLEGEGNRVDIVGPEGKCFEIFFFGEDILIMCEKKCWWKNVIYQIYISDDDGKPAIYCA